MNHRSSLSWTLGFTLVACSSSGTVGGASTVIPDVEGVYTVALSYGANGCDFEDWTEGAEVHGVVLRVQQRDAALVATVEGLTGGVLALVHGSNIYTGRLDGPEFDIRIDGQIPQVEGNCSYTLDNHAQGRFDGDFISGSLEFVVDGDGASDCSAVACSSRIDFTGSRAPKVTLDSSGE